MQPWRLPTPSIVTRQSKHAPIMQKGARGLPDTGVVRAWAALRVMTPDGFPVYDQSRRFPGAFVAACHSGVTLAAAHALMLAPLIAAGSLPADPFETFSLRRFDVQKAA